MKPTFGVSSNGDADFHKLKASLVKVAKAQVLVGIPEDETDRPGDGVTNAGLLYIHTHGSELQHIPPRPVIEPAIEAPSNKANIAAELGEGVRSVLAQQPSQAHDHLDKAGLLAANAAKRWFTDPENGWAPNSPATVEEKGSNRPLIDTAQMRRAITYVVEE